MSVPAAPDNYNEPPRSRVNAGQVWTAGLATAIVAALIAVVGILISRWLFHVPILAPSNEGAWGSANTAYYALAAACVALAATALLHLLMVGTPEPTRFLNWILGLVTVAAVVYPFSTGAPMEQKFATAVVDLVIGIAIMSLLTGVAARGYRTSSPRRRVPPQGYNDRPAYPPEREAYPPDRNGYPADSAPTRPYYQSPEQQ
ncbi:MAG: DUF6069 family protein [Streptosporangiaceae bacterium]|jgi:hypothetical protein